jgi:hypothetical protein
MRADVVALKKVRNEMNRDLKKAQDKLQEETSKLTSIKDDLKSKN